MRRKYKRFLKAAYIDYSEDYCSSGSSTFIKPTITTPIIVITGNTAIIACAISGVTIYYTLDGSTPTSSSTEYTGAITLTLSCTIKAIAVRPGMTDSEVASESYVHYLTQWKIVGNSEVHTLPYPDGVVLPTGYKRCKHLEFHGTEYIDSGIIPEQGIEVKTKYLPNTDVGVVFGTRSSAWSRDSLYIIRTGKPRAYNISYGGKVTDNMSSVVEEVEVNINSQSVKLNNTTIPITSTIIKGQNNLYIGGVNGLNLSYCYRGKIYFFKLSLNGADIFNGIPCLDDNNVPCLYDTVSQTTLYNQGTGTFGYEVEAQPTEIWSCGEYNATDGKYHILVQPQGGNVADIALDEPLRKVNDIADTIEFPSETEGKALVTRPLKSINLYDYINSISRVPTYYTSEDSKYAYKITCLSDVLPPTNNGTPINGLCSAYIVGSRYNTYLAEKTCISVNDAKDCHIYDSAFNGADDIDAFKAYITEVKPEFIYELATPTTELVDAPQIAEADSYSCVISQGGKAVSWSEFIYTLNYLLTDSENNLLVDSENYQLTVQS